MYDRISETLLNAKPQRRSIELAIDRVQNKVIGRNTETDSNVFAVSIGHFAVLIERSDVACEDKQYQLSNDGEGVCIQVTSNRMGMEYAAPYMVDFKHWDDTSTAVLALSEELVRQASAHTATVQETKLGDVLITNPSKGEADAILLSKKQWEYLVTHGATTTGRLNIFINREYEGQLVVVELVVKEAPMLPPTRHSVDNDVDGQWGQYVQYLAVKMAEDYHEPDEHSFLLFRSDMDAISKYD